MNPDQTVFKVAVCYGLILFAKYAILEFKHIW